LGTFLHAGCDVLVEEAHYLPGMRKHVWIVLADAKRTARKN
jgi:hypothetical protein